VPLDDLGLLQPFAKIRQFENLHRKIDRINRIYTIRSKNESRQAGLVIEFNLVNHVNPVHFFQP
jgi:hypothetical protein